MLVRKLIKEFFESNPAIHDASGAPVAPERLRLEYSRVRAFLLKNLAPQETVALSLENDYAAFLCLCACFETGFPALPMMPSWPRARVEQVRALTGYRTCINRETFESIIKEELVENAAAASLSPDQILYVMCTSGSTGEPKAVAISRCAFENFLKWFTDNCGWLGETSRFCQSYQLSFDASLIGLCLALTKRCRLYFSDFSSDIFRLAHDFERYETDCVSVVPSTLKLLLQEKVFSRVNLSKLKTFLICGELFPLSLYENFYSRFKQTTRLFNLYGPTEAAVLCTHKELSGDKSRDVSRNFVTVGKAFRGTELEIVGSDETLVRAPYQTGELLIGGGQLMEGYLNRPELTAKAFVHLADGKYYKTGDLAFFDEIRNYFVVGRTDDTIKRKGFRVNLNDINSYIERIDGVTQAATIHIIRPDGDVMLVSFVVSAFTAEEIRVKMAEVLAKYQIPDRIEIVEHIETATTGKVSNEKLLEILRIRDGREKP